MRAQERTQLRLGFRVIDRAGGRELQDIVSLRAGQELRVGTGPCRGMLRAADMEPVLPG